MRVELVLFTAPPIATVPEHLVNGTLEPLVEDVPEDGVDDGVDEACPRSQRHDGDGHGVVDERVDEEADVKRRPADAETGHDDAQSLGDLLAHGHVVDLIGYPDLVDVVVLVDGPEVNPPAENGHQHQREEEGEEETDDGVRLVDDQLAALAVLEEVYTVYDVFDAEVIQPAHQRNKRQKNGNNPSSKQQHGGHLWSDCQEGSAHDEVAIDCQATEVVYGRRARHQAEAVGDATRRLAQRPDAVPVVHVYAVRHHQRRYAHVGHGQRDDERIGHRLHVCEHGY